LLPTTRRPLEDATSYLVRNPLSLKKLVYLDRQRAVLLSLEVESLPGPKLST